jgi:hypothetical protein
MITMLEIMSEQLIPSSPVEALNARVASRQDELAKLTSEFELDFSVVTNLEVVNEIIAASERPDLVITDPATMMEVPDVAGLSRTNNFQPGMRYFGNRVYKELDTPDRRGNTKEWVGYAPMTDDELNFYFLIGARGDYDGYRQFAAENGLDKDDVIDKMMQTHIGKPAFMRMWIVCPELTVNLIRKCLDDREAYKEIGEELFVAYTLMSKLVDKKDPYVIRDLPGQVDEHGVDWWYLCR